MSNSDLRLLLVLMAYTTIVFLSGVLLGTGWEGL